LTSCQVANIFALSEIIRSCERAAHAEDDDHCAHATRKPDHGDPPPPREYDGPRHVYFPAVHPDEASRSALRQLVRTFFDDSPGSAIAALLDIGSTELSDAEYRRLSGMLKRARSRGVTE